MSQLGRNFAFLVVRWCLANALGRHCGPLFGESYNGVCIEKAISKLVTHLPTDPICGPALFVAQWLISGGHHDKMLQITPCQPRVSLQSKGDDGGS